MTDTLQTEAATIADQIAAHVAETLPALLAAFGEQAITHSVRFRKVANRYPHQVAVAYGGDIARAAADSDEQVAATVAAWELDHRLPVRDWPAIGAEERQ